MITFFVVDVDEYLTSNPWIAKTKLNALTLQEVTAVHANPDSQGESVPMVWTLNLNIENYHFNIFIFFYFVMISYENVGMLVLNV